jgi:hypothetical protein
LGPKKREMKGRKHAAKRQIIRDTGNKYENQSNWYKNPENVILLALKVG